MAKNSQLSRALKHYSMNLIDSVANFVLWSMYLGLDGFTPKMWEKRLYQPEFELINNLVKHLDHHTIYRAIYHLKRQGLIDYITDAKKIKPRWTKLGKERLKGKIPQYQTERPWNGRTYLVTYDIDETDRKIRDKFRDYLKTIHCVPLQASVYFSVPDPRDLVEEFVNQHHLSFEVLVSDLGKSGAIGQKTLPELVQELYQLDSLHHRYQQFINQFSSTSRRNPLQCSHAGFAFLSIVHDDPQLPHELLPYPWAGDKAYRLYQKIIYPELTEKSPSPK